MNAAKDYAQADDEEVVEPVLTFLEKLKRIWEVSKWLRAVFMVGKVLFVGSGAAVIVGEVTGETFVKDAAVEMGIVEASPVDTAAWSLREEQISQFAAIQQEINELKTHGHNYPDPVVPAGQPGKVGPRGEPGPRGEQGNPGPPGKDATATLTPELKASIMKEVEAMLPKDHRKLH